MSIFKEAKNIGELKELLSNLPDDLPVNLQQLKQMRKNKLPKAQLQNHDWSLNTEKYDAIFTARGEMIRASSLSFIQGKIDYSHVVCWKVPYDEPFSGLNASELKAELTKKIIGGILEKDDRGKEVIDPTLLNLIMSDVSKWARDMLVVKQDNYFVRDFAEVYDFKYSVAARVANTAVFLEVSYI